LLIVKALDVLVVTAPVKSISPPAATEMPVLALRVIGAEMVNTPAALC